MTYLDCCIRWVRISSFPSWIYEIFTLSVSGVCGQNSVTNQKQVSYFKVRYCYFMFVIVGILLIFKQAYGVPKCRQYQTLSATNHICGIGGERKQKFGQKTLQPRYFQTSTGICFCVLFLWQWWNILGVYVFAELCPLACRLWVPFALVIMTTIS